MIVIGIVLTVVVLWPKNKSNNLSNITMIKTPWKDKYLPVELKRPKKVEWNISENSNSTISKIEASRPENEKERVGRVLAIKGLKNTDIKSEQEGLINYSKYGITGYWSPTRSFVQVVENITSINQVKTENNLELAEIRTKIENILKDIDTKEIRWANIEYNKIVYPRMVASDEVNGNIIVFKGDWVVDGKSVRSFVDNSIKITTTRNGRIIGVDIYLLPEMTVNGVEKVVSQDILEKTNYEDIGIVNYVGGKDYELNVDDIRIENVNVTQKELIYIYDGRRNKVVPYFLLTGTSVAMGPVKVEMITGAVRE